MKREKENTGASYPALQNVSLMPHARQAVVVAKRRDRPKEKRQQIIANRSGMTSADEGN